jgi:molecular chaperone DnaK
MKFYNVVNQQEQVIGDLWLGIDRDKTMSSEKETEKPRKLVQPPRIEITLDIDENNLVSVNAALLHQPEVAVSRTLSRGKADEKLFLALEQAITEADQANYSAYTVVDLQNRAREIIALINRVVDAKDDRVDEERYEQASNQIKKAVKIAANEEAPLTQVYYAESMLEDYNVLIAPDVQELLRTRIEKLCQVDKHGSYEETMRASAALSAALDDQRLAQVNTLMQIENASEICFTRDPGKAKRFMRIIAEVLEAAENQDDRVLDKLDAILHEVDEVLENYAMSTQKIHRDIRK